MRVAFVQVVRWVENWGFFLDGDVFLDIEFFRKQFSITLALSMNLSLVFLMLLQTLKDLDLVMIFHALKPNLLEYY